MKRVLLIAPYPYLPFFSGGQKHIAQFTEYLGQETELTVISTRSNDAELAKGYTLLPWLPNSPLRYLDLRLYKKISAAIKSNRFDCILWEHPYYYWLARLIRKKHKIFTIIHSHNIEYQRFRSTGRWWWPILQLYEGACLKMADLNFFISSSDQLAAIQKWKLDPTRSAILPLGIRQERFPADRSSCQLAIQEKFGIPAATRILLFNGLLNYEPNRKALIDLLDHVIPQLQKQKDFNYRLIICGKYLDSSFDNLRSYAHLNVIYAGFVADIEVYFKAADVFLNPILSGGGVKTKVVEAIGLGTTVVSTETGSTGIDVEATGSKLRISKDSDWESFAKLIIEEAGKSRETPIKYYNTYSWRNIIHQVVEKLPKQSAG